MKDEFPYVKIPPELRQIMGKLQEGTRCYYAEGDETRAGIWFDTMCQHFVGVSPRGCFDVRAGFEVGGLQTDEGRTPDGLFLYDHGGQAGIVWGDPEEAAVPLLLMSP